MMDLSDKVAVIVGASTSISLEVAKTFKTQNAIVVIAYLDNDKEQKAAVIEFAERYDIDLTLEIDIKKTDSVSKCFHDISENYGKIDVLVNSPSVNLGGDFDKITDEMWQKVIDCNLKGPFICMREVYNYISKGGKVINLGSISGQLGGPRTTSYACAAAGIMALTHCYARYAGPRKNVSVNCVSPGLIESEKINSMPEKMFSNMQEDLLIKRLGTSQEVANLISFLASDNSSFITGQTIGINGGVWV